MRLISLKVFVVLLLALSLEACSQEDVGVLSNVKTLNTNKISDIKYYASKYPEAHYDELQEAADSIVCYAGKSVAVFGGSLAANAECDVCKSMYKQLLHCSSVVTYAHGGYGYATTNGSVQDFLPILDRHDIYILWCSTNDYDSGVQVGSPADYTTTDGYDEEHTNTQCGGLNKCIRAIREKNPNALIVGFTSLRFLVKTAHAMTDTSRMHRQRGMGSTSESMWTSKGKHSNWPVSHTSTNTIVGCLTWTTTPLSTSPMVSTSTRMAISCSVANR